MDGGKDRRWMEGRMEGWMEGREDWNKHPHFQTATIRHYLFMLTCTECSCELDRHKVRFSSKLVPSPCIFPLEHNLH